jgi:HEAT repeat protein
MRNLLLTTLVLLGGLGTPTPARAYIAAMPTLGKVCTDASHIVVLEVERVSRDKQVVVFKKVADLKGKGSPGVAKHKLADGFHPRQARAILDWAEPGKIAVCFQMGRNSLTCIGGLWYQCAAVEDPWWTMTAGRPELSYAYRGSTAKLRNHLTAMLEGREVVVTALKFRLLTLGRPEGVVRKWEDVDAIEAVGARRLMRGKDWPVCRIKASLKMPNTVFEAVVHHPELSVGDGPGGPEDVPALVKGLKHEEARVRVEAAEDLGQIGPAAADGVALLLALAERDPDPLVRLEAAKAVAGIDPKNKTAIPLLVAALKDRNGKVRRRGAECLGDLGPRARSAVADLVQTVKDPDPTVSWAAIDALGQIGPDAAPAVPSLVEALRDRGTRGAAVDALGQVGGKARDAVPALEQVLRGEDVPGRWAAASALVRIGGPGVKAGVRYMLETATRERERNWTDATNVLMAPTSRAAVPVLLDAVRDPAVRQLASDIAAEVSVYLTKDPLADVKGFLKDEDAGVRCVSAWVLHSARAVEVKDVIAVQRGVLKAPDSWARRQAARYLGKLGPVARDAAEALAAPLRDKDEGVRDAAAAALKNVQQ